MNEYDDLADLDDVLGPLRSAARPAELARESATVDLMVHAHRTVEGKHMFTSRRARIATLVAAGVLGFGGMAAASPNLSELLTTDPPAEEPAGEEPVVEEPPADEPPAEPPVDEDPPVAEPIVEPVVVEEAVVEEAAEAEEPTDGGVSEDDLDPDPDTEFHEGYCEDGNHGKTVSAVARGVFDPDEEYPEDLELSVKIAAQSSCGKTADIDDASDVDDEIESEIEQADEPEVEKVEESEPKAERPGKGDKGAEKASKGKSNGKGNAGGKPGR